MIYLIRHLPFTGENFLATACNTGEMVGVTAHFTVPDGLMEARSNCAGSSLQKYKKTFPMVGPRSSISIVLASARLNTFQSARPRAKPQATREEPRRRGGLLAGLCIWTSRRNKYIS